MGQGTTRHGHPVVQRRRQQCVEGGDIQEVTILVPKYEDDDLIFIEYQVSSDGLHVLGGMTAFPVT